MTPEKSRAILARVRLLVLDVDGTLTDGRVVYAGEEELQSFHVHDGQGLAWLTRAGVEVAWVTGRGCAATEKRARELGVRELVMGSGPKEAVVAEIQERLGVDVEATVAMGDDLPDLAMAARAALFACPADARPEVVAAADLVTSAAAGAGAVRELCDAILQAGGRWDALAERSGPGR